MSLITSLFIFYSTLFCVSKLTVVMEEEAEVEAAAAKVVKVCMFRSGAPNVLLIDCDTTLHAPQALPSSRHLSISLCTYHFAQQ